MITDKQLFNDLMDRVDRLERKVATLEAKLKPIGIANMAEEEMTGIENDIKRMKSGELKDRAAGDRMRARNQKLKDLNRLLPPGKGRTRK